MYALFGSYIVRIAYKNLYYSLGQKKDFMEELVRCHVLALRIDTIISIPPVYTIVRLEPQSNWSPHIIYGMCNHESCDPDTGNVTTRLLVNTYNNIKLEW